MSAVVVHGDHRIRPDFGKCRRELVCGIGTDAVRPPWNELAAVKLSTLEIV